MTVSSSTSSSLTKWTQPTTMLSTILAMYIGYRAVLHLNTLRHQRALEPSPMDPLLKNNIQFVSVNGKKLRVVHVPHALGSKVPLVVFIHGVGGQLEQFEKQIIALSANILAVDMCGYGGSDVPESYGHYTTEAYVEDVVALLQRYKSEDTVLICHSYGCAIGTLLYDRMQQSIKGIVMIGPKALVTLHEQQSKARLAKTPDWAVDLARKVDRIGGIHSQSVNRLVHSSASDDLRRRQLRWNKASKTLVLKRLMAGVHYPTQQDFCKIQCPLLLLAGEDDRVCPPVNAEQIFKWRQGLSNLSSGAPFIIPRAGHQTMLEKWELVNPIISAFFIKECGLSTIDQAWQLTLESQKENKWSLKNLEKWQNTPIISSSIGRGEGKFRAMKVLRQTDQLHSPSAFLAQHPEVGFIIDISLDAPPYRTTDFDATSITYIKLPTVSKVPPSKDDVKRFIAQCRACWAEKPGMDIAVHCHYGFNRTGLMLCSYLIEEQKYSVSEALVHFQETRPPKGIRHEHFKGELYLRYEAPPQLNTVII
ncbi:hypothetical protein BG005_005877 [Podila minutissima]|nr:hypothetical protein BG005_005877 [Podila minutissima]